MDGHYWQLHHCRIWWLICTNWRSRGRVHCGRLRHYRALRPRRSAHCHQWRWRAPLSHGLAALRQYRSLRAGQHRHWLHQRYRCADHGVPIARLTGRRYRPHAWRFLYTNAGHRQAHRHVQPLQHHTRADLFCWPRCLAQVVRQYLCAGARTRSPPPRAAQCANSRTHPWADRGAANTQHTRLATRLASRDHWRALRSDSQRLARLCYSRVLVGDRQTTGAAHDHTRSLGCD